MLTCIIKFIKRVGEKDKMRRFAEYLIDFPPTSLINTIIKEHEWKIPFIIWY